MIANSSAKKNIKFMVFIDDKKTNVDGFNALQTTTNIKLYGILFKNPKQLADELVNLGILSRENDHKLFAKI